jgi:hypothetical protein
MAFAAGSTHTLTSSCCACKPLKPFLEHNAVDTCFSLSSQSTTGVMVQDQTMLQLRLAAYNEVCEKVVSENVFSQYIYKTLPSCNHLWVFKKAFCTQMALSGM